MRAFSPESKVDARISCERSGLGPSLYADVETPFVYEYERSNRLSPVFSPRDRVEGSSVKMVSSSWRTESKMIRRLVFVASGQCRGSKRYEFS